MTDEVKTVTEPLAPIPVTVIGGGTGDGGSPLVSGIAKTPDHQPNLLVTVVTPIAAILIRFINNYLTMLVALVGTGMASNVIPASDFAHLVWACAKLSVATAGFAALKDCVTVFGRLEGKFPLLTGSV